jgi:hypothetical protein
MEKNSQYRLKKSLYIILNKILEKQKNLLYGDGSEIIVDRIEWVRSKKTYIINVTIMTINIEESIEVHPEGIEYLIKCGWPILGRRCNPIIVSSLDVI